MINRLVTIFCLAALVLELLIVIINVLLKKWPARVAFLRSFKKGKCAIIYVTAIPLYCIGYIYAGQSVSLAFFTAISKIGQLVVLQYDVGGIQDLMIADPLYNFAIYFCFVLVGINALIFTLSIMSQHIWCALQAFRAMTVPRDKMFIFGNNPENISIYLSDNKRNKVIIDDISDADREKLYMNRISFISTNTYEEPIEKLFHLVRKFDKEYIVVVNTRDDEKNIRICRAIIKSIEGATKDVKERLFIKTKIFVFGSTNYEAIYGDIVSSGFGCIHYVNKYQKIAMDFIDKYPLSKFMDEEQIDYDTSLIKEGVDINVLFVGFGKTARQLFLTSVANNQFLKQGEKDPELKQVKYFIIDKDAAENNKNLNHNYYRYRNECTGLNSNEYLPLPSLPAEEHYFAMDVNDSEFYNCIHSVVTKSDKDVNFVIIAFGSDLENIDMAQKLVEKRREWEIKNLVIFVKVRAWRKEQMLLEDEGCYFIGNENDSVYNIDKIIGDRILSMAQMRNEIYDLEYAITNNPEMVLDSECIRKNRDLANRNWHIKKSQLERESSLYCCLSLRSKLNLMGLDYCKKETPEDKGISEEEYLAIYAGADIPDTSKYAISTNGKKIVNYTLEFPVSRRRNMAIHEHLRWNSFMISKGIIPASREQIEFEKVIGEDGKERFTNGKNYTMRRHGNLTTLEGLVEFRRIIALRDNTTEEEKDVIKYDYQILDDAYWFLNSNDYKIVKNVKLK